MVRKLLNSLKNGKCSTIFSRVTKSGIWVPAKISCFLYTAKKDKEKKFKEEIFYRYAQHPLLLVFSADQSTFELFNSTIFA